MMPALRDDMLSPIDLQRLEPVTRATHPPRILLLYGSLRARSYSRLLVEEAGRMRPGPLYDRVVDVMEELVRFTWLLRDRADYLVDRYSERVAAARLGQTG